MLPYIDYEAFRRHPKLVVGYSDATAVLLALYAKREYQLLWSGPHTFLWRV